MQAFLANLKTSNLLSAAEWADVDLAVEAESRRQRPAAIGLDPARVAGRLVERGLLTRWQADMLLSGHNAFFLGRYKLLEKIGVGGMGAVFKARHANLGRTVALKLMSSSLVKDTQAVARFRREIQAVASLNHPNIVSAYDAESVGDTHFLIMEYVAGHDLGHLLQRDGPLPIAWACECIRQAAVGLQHAHERGMVHRDIKPTNLLVTWTNRAEEHAQTGPARPGSLVAGSLVVKILDMGLARLVSEAGEESGLTQSGEVLGTPDYIAPEQAADTHRADIRSDIFSLGCTLFRLLTGQVPFKGKSMMEKLMARAMANAPPVRSLRPEVPVELDAVLAKMLARDPEQRYQAPREVAAALEPFTRNLSAVPWPPAGGPPDAVANDATIRTAANGDSDANTDADSRLEQFLRHLATEAETADDAPTVAASRPADELEAVAIRSLISPSRANSTKVLDSESQATVTRDLTGSVRALRKSRNRKWWIIAVVTALIVCAVGGARWWSTSGTTEPVIVRPADQRGGGTGEIDRKPARQRELAKLQDRVKGRAAADVKSVEGAALRDDLVAFLHANAGTDEALAAARELPRIAWPLDLVSRDQIPADELRAAGYGDGANVPRELVAILGDSRLKHWNQVQSLAVSPDGELIAAAGLDDTVKLWDRETGQARHTLFAGDRRLALLFQEPSKEQASPQEPGRAGPESALLAIVGDTRGLILWDTQQGTPVRQIRDVEAPAAFSPDGKLLAVQGKRREIVIASVATGAIRHTLPGHSSKTLRSLAFSRDGNTLVSAGSNGLVRLWEVASGEMRREFDNARQPLLSPDDMLLAAGTAMNTITLWNPVDGARRTVLEEAGEPLAFTSDGGTLASLRNGRVILWDLATGEELRTLTDVAGLIAISPDRRFLAAGDPDFGWLHFRDVTTGAARSVAGHSASVTCLAFTPDSATLVTGSADHAIKLWDAANATERPLAGSGVAAADLSPDGGALALAGTDGTLRLWDVASRTSSRTLEQNAKSVHALAFSPNGEWLACIGDWGFFTVTVRIWDAGSGRELNLVGDPPGTIRTLAFSPDSQLLATAGDGRSILLWDLTTRKVRQTLDDFPDRVEALAFHPGGETLAVACRNKTVTLWNLAAGRERFRLNHNSAVVQTLAFSADGKTLATGTTGDRIHLWNPATGELQRSLAAPGGAINTLQFSLDGTRLAAASSTGRVHLWNLPPSTLGEEKPDRTFALGHSGGIVRQALFSPEGRHLLTVNGNGTLYVLRLHDFTPLSD